MNRKDEQYNSVEAYFRKTSAILQIDRIRTPLLAIQALDDPFLRPLNESAPVKELIDNPQISVLQTSKGGHLGWFEGNGSYFPFGNGKLLQRPLISFIIDTWRENLSQKIQKSPQSTHTSYSPPKVTRET